jgi:hypothetical protein
MTVSPTTSERGGPAARAGRRQRRDGKLYFKKFATIAEIEVRPLPPSSMGLQDDGGVLSFYCTAIDCHWLSFLRDLCSNLAVIVVI